MMHSAITQKTHPMYRAFVWMCQHVSEYLDACNEVDCTRLAEDAADEFDLYVGDEATIPEELFEGAFLAHCKLEEKRAAG